MPVGRSNQGAQEKEGHVDKKEHENTFKRIFAHRFLIDLHQAHLARLQCMSDFAGRGFAQQHRAYHFHAAGGRTRTGADEHQHDQQNAGELRPQIKVSSGKARGRHDGGHLKAGVAQGVKKVPVLRNAKQRDEQNRCQGKGIVKANFFIFEGFAAFPPKNVKVDDEVGAKKNKAWLWIILLITITALIIWRIRETQPHRIVQKLQDNSKKLLIYWQAFSLAMLYGGKPMLESETLRDYAGRTAPGDEGLYKLSDAVSGVLYGKYKADDAEVTTSSLYYQSAYAALSPLGRVKLIGKRLWLDSVQHIKTAWQFVYAPVNEVLKGFSRTISQSWSDFLKKLKKLIKKR